jgi:hypothetical protein
MEQVIDHARLAQIGNELFDRSRAATLDFATFQRLFSEAVAVCGPDSDEMETFRPFAKRLPGAQPNPPVISARPQVQSPRASGGTLS